ncbi:MAG: peptidase S41 [Winogradskyella sp.]|uniref:S41 family peptidase n=1 Tax=Winogradskyella sp. TaxID=1883156 RepID=UPI000F3D8A42|nr:S41 family peptidase [Winogradskyella sp.]RNC87045.1 MAG: peptidase S41 [Winogradskyella sp.]
MKRLLLLASIILLTSCGSIATYNEAVTKMHPVEDLHEDVDKVYRQLQKLHPRLYQYTPRETLDFKFDSLKTALNKPMTSRDFHKELSKVTKYVGQGHMSLSSPNTRFTRKERKARLKTKFDISNLSFEYVDERLIIREARGKDSLLLHAEVLKVNDDDAIKLFNTYKEIVASDGYNTTFHDRVVGYRFLGYYAIHNGRFDSISLTLRNSDSTFVKSYKRELKNKKKTETDSSKQDSLKLKKPKKLSKAQRKLKRKEDKIKSKLRRKKNKKYGYNYSTKKYNRNLSFIGKDSTVALLKIRSFTRGKYKDFYEETFTRIDSAQSKHLIIDLRNNFGGRLNEIQNLYSYLTDKNFTLINRSETNTRLPLLKTAMSNSSSTGTKLFYGILSPVIIAHNLIATSKKDGQLYYKFKASKAHEPNPLNFKGKIFVLINGNSFSASSVLSTQLDGDNRATFVGEETGGAYNGTVAGYYKNYTLPNTKVRARIGLMHIDSKHKTDPDGYGIKPDVEILPTYQDRLDNIDPEIDWVLTKIGQKN